MRFFSFLSTRSSWTKAVTGFLGLSALLFGLTIQPQVAKADPLATCVQTAVTARTITAEAAGTRTNASWACRTATPAELADTSDTARCIRGGCSGGGSNLCCAPAAPTDATPSTAAPGTTPTPTPGVPGSASEGSCQFNCTPPIAVQTCTVDSDCTATCQGICERSFTGGSCVTTGAAAAKCAIVTGQPERQCVFTCSITPTTPRTCNPRGTDAQAPATVCGNFCETSCQEASRQPATGAAPHFCQNTTVCLANGSTGGATTPAAGGGATTIGAGTGGQNLVNPLPGITSIADLVGRIIKGILGVVGSLALLMFVYGGVRWIVSAGEPKEITAAQHIIRNATIGLFLIFFAYTLSGLVLGLVDDVAGSATAPAATNGQTTPSASGPTLATCVQTAVTAGRITQNDARDRTNASWACRETTAEERAEGSTTCVRNGCPRNNATTLCCPPAVPPPAPAAP